MLHRRDMLQILGRLLIGCGSVIGTLATRVSSIAAEKRKRLVPSNADPDRLRNANPRYLDTRNLQPMPLARLESVGDQEAPFDEATWRLVIGGDVAHPATLTYQQIKSMPYVERDVLLICQGIFAFHGRWKGIPLSRIIQMVRPSKSVKACIVSGHSRSGVRKERFKLNGSDPDELLLAYAVNGQILALKNGFPLRIVAPGRWGEEWMKYVMAIEFV